MRRIFTMLCVLLAVLNVNAQTEIDTATLLSSLNQAPFIIEGRVIEQCTYEEPTTKIIYTNNIVEITKVIKGSLQCGTVSLITEGGNYMDRYLEISHTTKFNVDVTGIFVCNSAPYYYSNTCPSTSNSLRLTPMLREFSEIEYYKDFINEIALGFNSQFNDINDLYSFLQNVAGLSVTDCNQGFAPQNWENNNYTATKKIPFVEDNNILYKTTAVGDEVKYTFGSLDIVTGDGGRKYYECQIRIQANDSASFLQRGAFRLKYNPKAFGINKADSATVTLSSNFPVSVYGTLGNGGIQRINKSDSVMSFIITRISGNRTKLTTTPKDFFTIRIPFDTCRHFPNLKMIDTFSTINQFNLYTTSATGSTTNQYDLVTANNSKQGANCEPIIYSVTSEVTGKDTATGGFNEPILIKGKHFGNARPKVFTPNADYGGQNYVRFDDYDIKVWSDTSIRITLPSNIIDTVGGYNEITPGGGRYIVENKWKAQNKLTTIQNDSIFIKWSLSGNYKYPYGSSMFYKNYNLLFSRFTGGGYKFQFHPNVTNDTLKKTIIAALNYWRCATGVDFRIDAAVTSSTATFANDKINIIYIDSSYSSNSSTIASCYQFSNSFCTSTITQSPFPVTNIDIKINPYFLSSFQYDTTGTQSIITSKIDFYSVILHELGHGLGLYHVCDSNDLMYAFAKNSPTPASQRSNKIGYWNQQAGDTIVLESTQIGYYGFNCGLDTVYNMIAQHTGDSCRAWPLAIAEISKKPNVEEVNIYPNPFNTILNIDFLEHPQNASCTLYDMNGKVILTSKLNEQKNQIQLNNIQAGNYFITIQNNNQWQSRKVICIQ